MGVGVITVIQAALASPARSTSRISLRKPSYPRSTQTSHLALVDEDDEAAQQGQHLVPSSALDELERERSGAIPEASVNADRE
jgi:hypothetical protein